MSKQLQAEVDRLKAEVEELTAELEAATKPAAPPTPDGPEEVWIRLLRDGAGLAVLELRTRGNAVVSRRVRKEHDIAEVAMGRAHQWLLQDAEPDREWSDRAPA